MIRNLFLENELSMSSTFSTIAQVASAEYNLIKNFGRILQYYDEPKFWQYSAHLNAKFLDHDGGDFQSVASGVSFTSERIAISKCLYESIERYCNHVFFNSSTRYKGTYKSLNSKALNPLSIASLSKNQSKKAGFKKFLISDHSKFTWTDGASLIEDEKILIPSQLIYLSYPHIPNEPVIYSGISTGAAGGSCLSAALVRGICEIVERDAFMIFYLNKLQAAKIKLDQINDSRIKNLLVILSRYKMEVYTFDITTDIDIPTSLTVVVDRSGYGKAITLGLKSDLNQVESIVGSIEETFNSRSWIRTEYEKSSNKITQSDLLKKSDIRNRGLLWFPVEAIAKLDFLLKSPNTKSEIRSTSTKSTSGRKLKSILQRFKNLGYDVIYKDITVPTFKKLNYFVVKAIIPQMHPLYLDENSKLLGGSRLFEVPNKLGFKPLAEDQLNTYPHPFL